MRRRARVAKLWVTLRSKNHLTHCNTINSLCHALCSGYNNVVCYSSLCKNKVQFMGNSFWKQPAAECEVHVSAEWKTWRTCFESLYWLHHVFCMWRENVVFFNSKVHICVNLFTLFVVFLCDLTWTPSDSILTLSHIYIRHCCQTLTSHHLPCCQFLDPLWPGLYRQWQESMWQLWWWKLWHVSMVAVQRGMTGLDRTVYPVSWDSMSALCVTIPQGHSLCERDTRTNQCPC